MLIYKREVFAIMGAAFEVYKVLGPGFLEAVYHEALEIELTARKVPFHSYYPLKLTYKDRVLNKTYEADFLCYEGIILELKAQYKLTLIDQAQVINYFKGNGFAFGVGAEFGE